MQRLNPSKLQVTYLTGTTPEQFTVPRRYTLTHSDINGNLFLSIGREYETKQIAGFYTRLMRDEVLAELSDSIDSPVFRIYCHISGGFVFGSARFRYKIFKSELPLVLEAIRYGDRALFKYHPELDNASVHIHMQSNNKRFNKIENWGSMSRYS